MQKKRSLKIYILADNALVVNGLRHVLEEKFGDAIQVFNYYDARNFLRSINNDTDAVVVDYLINGKSAEGIIREVRLLNPVAEVVMHSSNQDVVGALQALLNGRSPATVSKKFSEKIVNQFY